MIQKHLLEFSKTNPAGIDKYLVFWNEYLKELDDMKKVKLSFCLNDNGDILVQITPTSYMFRKVNEQKHYRIEIGDYEQSEIIMEEGSSFYYYIANQNNNRNGEYIYLTAVHPGDDKNKSIRGVSMNQRYIFLWNLGSVWKLCLKEKTLSQMPIYISEREKSTAIKRVRTGSNQDIVCVRVQQT